MTRVLIISDVHANAIALEAVLAHAGQVDATWCLGDVVGYGPQPNQCIERIRSLPNLTCMMGNHDFGAVGEGALEIFNADAKKALLWQRMNLSHASREFLSSMHNTLLVNGDVSLAHGSPRDPIWEYVMNPLVARLNLGFFQTPWCFVGHSHFQVVFQYNPKMDDVSIVIPSPSEKYVLKDRAILNPGSVGQPRDRDPRAAFAIYSPDENWWEPRRVEYDIPAVQKMILEAGLPSRHAERLAGGW
jgi:diadenosine tetraphosphatase ApaH/serine/threonine PP2A family protein phosphatase